MSNLDNTIRNHSLAKLNWALHAGGVLVVCGIVGITYWGGIEPVINENQRLQVEARLLEKILDSRDDIVKQKQEAQQLLQERNARLEELLARIPGAPNEDDFLAQLSQLSRSSGMIIRQFRPGQRLENENYSSVEVEVEGEATFASICRFLHDLPQLPRMCEVINLNIRENSSGSNIYPISITLHIFYAPIQSTTDSLTDSRHAAASHSNS